MSTAAKILLISISAQQE